MIPAAGIQDQELAIAAKRSGVNYPTVAWGRDLRAGMAGDRQPLLGSAERRRSRRTRGFSRRSPASAGGRASPEGNRRSEPARIVERGDIGPVSSVAWAAACARAIDAIESRFELGDQVLEAVDLARKIGRMLPLRRRAPVRAAASFFCRSSISRFMRSCSSPSTSRSRASRWCSATISLRTRNRSARSPASASACRAHSRNHGAEHDGGAQRVQCILRPHDQRRRRFVPNPLQGGENFDDHGAALVERLAKQLLAARRAA